MTTNAMMGTKEAAAGAPATAQKIMQLMASLGISGQPRNYELLYEACAGGNAALVKEIAALGKSPEQASLDALAIRYGLASHNALAAGQAAGEALRLIGEMSSVTNKCNQDKAIALQEIREIADRLTSDPVFAMTDFASDASRLLAIVQDLLSAERILGLRTDDILGQMRGVRSGMAASHEALTHDTVTGLGNQAALATRLKSHFESEDEKTAALLLVRIDRLKGFMDTHVAGAADQTLRQLAALFRQSLKKNDFVARTGPDQFALLLADVNRDNAASIAARIRGKVEAESFSFPGRDLPPGFLSLTGGIAFTDAARSPSVLVSQSEQALAVAGEGEGREIRFYSADIAARAARNYRRDVA
ncbi:GGDEF domain-containing protein [Sinorhizobium sp. BG8]|uniref:GGDEF domain-containing protein n=1 Tax=Sinorhizobium sp. BG8 TaxID=2613773 RepID=UPI00193EA878|nr:GGDEF domain-containing protein [Sinorhizobium sp. BG8]